MSAKAKTALFVTGLSSLFITGSGTAIFGPAVPVFEQSFQIPTATAGLLISALWVGCLGGVAGSFFWGARMTPRLPVALLTLGSVVLALAPFFGLVLAGGLIFGLGYGGVAALYNPRFLQAFGASGAAKVGLLNAVYSLGAILAPYGFTLIGSDLRPVFWAMAAVSALTWVMSGRVGRFGLVPEAQGRGFTPHYRILGLALVAIGIEASLSGLGPAALMRGGLGETEAALLLSLFFGAALAARILLVLFAHLVPDFAIFVFAALWATICALGAAMISAPVFYPLLGIAAGLFFQGEYVTAMRKMGDDPRVSPVILGLGLVGAIFSPLVYARLMDGFGPQGFFWLVAMVAGATALASLAFYREMMR